MTSSTEQHDMRTESAEHLLAATQATAFGTGTASNSELSTQRVREFRARQRKLGARPSGMVLSSRAQLAIDVIKSVRGQRYKVRAMEEALVNEARRLCSCDERIDQLVSSGKLTNDLALAWRETLGAVEVEEAEMLAAQVRVASTSDVHPPASAKKKRKLPLDLRIKARTK